MNSPVIIGEGEQREWVLVNDPTREIHITQQAGSSLHLVIVDLPTAPRADTANDRSYTIRIDQVGEHCTTDIDALAYVTGQDKVSIHTAVSHLSSHTESRQLIKVVLADHAQGHFLGELHIQPNAQQVNAQQTNRNLLLSPNAVMRTQPQLEIYADDVKASHGASTGQLDESALFYMQQRGIDPHQARQMLIGAFMKEALEKITDSTQRESLMSAVDSVL